MNLKFLKHSLIYCLAVFSYLSSAGAELPEYLHVPYEDPYRIYWLRTQQKLKANDLSGVRLDELRTYQKDFTGQLTLPVKTEEETHQWMQCHTPKSRYSGHSKHEDYESYVPYIQAASDAFGLPYALIACKIWQESKWNRTAQSPYARGLAQFRISTINDFNDVTRSNKDVDTVTAELNEMLSQLEHTRSLKKQEQLLKDIRLTTRYLRNANRRDILLPKWRAYVEAVQKINGPYSSYPKHLNPEALCRKNSCDNWEYHNPLWAIGAAGFYLQDLLINIDIDYNYERVDEPGVKFVNEGMFYLPYRFLDPNEPITLMREELDIDHFFVLGTAAYNAGLGRLVRSYMKSGSDLVEWLEKAKKTNRESYNHMLKIAACLQPENFVHPTDRPVSDDLICKSR